jgi:hypothetical protein
MKRPFLVVCLLSFAFLAGLPGFAQETYKFRVPDDREPFYGTWVNKEYANQRHTFPKFVYHDWGYAEGFKQVGDETATVKFTFILVEKWTDSKGNTWYKEQIYRSQGFPVESDLSPKYSNYWIFRRQ